MNTKCLRTAGIDRYIVINERNAFTKNGIITMNLYLRHLFQFW